MGMKIPFDPSGPHPGKAGTHLPGDGTCTDVDVTTSGAGQGNNLGSPSCKPGDAAPPGGCGSSGSASSSSPKGM